MSLAFVPPQQKGPKGPPPNQASIQKVNTINLAYDAFMNLY